MFVGHHLLCRETTPDPACACPNSRKSASAASPCLLDSLQDFQHQKEAAAPAPSTGPFENSCSNIISWIRHRCNGFCCPSVCSRHQQQQQSRSFPPWPVIKFCDFGVWMGRELGRGYSGSVHSGLGVLLNAEESDICDSRPLALKLSRPRQILSCSSPPFFSPPGGGSGANNQERTTGSCWREFLVLRYLYGSGVPVPRPLGLSLSIDDEGNGRTALLMDLVRGVTLRDWLNHQKDWAVRHPASGRTVHPAPDPDSAVQRLEIMVKIIEALEKLHPLGVFVDLKPRNIMVQSPVTPGSVGGPKITLVDIGGIMLREEVAARGETEGGESEGGGSDASLDGRGSHVSTAAPSSSSGSGEEWVVGSSGALEVGGGELRLDPWKHRALLETTCSYLSPELAAIVVQNDLDKQAIDYHFSPTLRERGILIDRRLHNKQGMDEGAAMYSLLEEAFNKTLDNLETQAVITRSKSEGGRAWTAALGQKSAVFSLGLILTELCGGLRTGITALAAEPTLITWFSPSAANAVAKDYVDRVIKKRGSVGDERRQRGGKGGVGDEKILNTIIKSPTGAERNSLSLRLKRFARAATTPAPTKEAAGYEWASRMFEEENTNPNEKRKLATDFEFRVALEWELPQLPSELCSERGRVLLEQLRFLQKNYCEAKTVVTDTEPFLLAFRDLYRRHCLPKEGVFGEAYKATLEFRHHAGGGSSSSSFLSLPLGQVMHQIIDRCLNGSPLRRFDFVSLRRALEGLALLLRVTSASQGGREFPYSARISEAGLILLEAERNGEPGLPLIRTVVKTNNVKSSDSRPLRKGGERKSLTTTQPRSPSVELQIVPFEG